MHFWCGSTEGRDRFLALVHPRTFVHKFSTEAIKLQFILRAVLIEMYRNFNDFRTDS